MKQQLHQSTPDDEQRAADNDKVIMADEWHLMPLTKYVVLLSLVVTSLAASMKLLDTEPGYY